MRFGAIYSRYFDQVLISPRIHSLQFATSEININQSPTSQARHQHILSATFATNIDVQVISHYYESYIFGLIYSADLLISPARLNL